MEKYARIEIPGFKEATRYAMYESDKELIDIIQQLSKEFINSDEREYIDSVVKFERSHGRIDTYDVDIKYNWTGADGENCNECTDFYLIVVHLTKEDYIEQWLL